MDTLNIVFTKKKNVVFLALLCAVLWGSAYPGVKIGYELFGLVGANAGSKVLFAGYRFAVAGLLILMICCFLERKVVLPEKKDWKGILVLGFVQTFVQYFFYYIGLSNTSGSKGAIVYATGTFLSVILAHFFYKNDRMNLAKVMGCLLGFGGIIVMNLGNELSSRITFGGEGMLIIGATAFAVATLLSKYIAKGQNPMILTAYQMLLGGVALIVCGYGMGGHINTMGVTAIGMFLYLAVLSSVAFTVWTLLLKYNPVSKISIYNALLPVLGAVLSGIFLGDDIWRMKTVVAIACVTVGIYIINREKH